MTSAATDTSGRQLSSQWFQINVMAYHVTDNTVLYSATRSNKHVRKISRLHITASLIEECTGDPWKIRRVRRTMHAVCIWMRMKLQNRRLITLYICNKCYKTYHHDSVDENFNANQDSLVSHTFLCKTKEKCIIISCIKQLPVFLKHFVWIMLFKAFSDPIYNST